MVTSPRSRLLSGFIAALALVGGAVVAEAGSPQDPRCFGAQSRDRSKPCSNPALRNKVVPTPAEAVLATHSPCVMQEKIGELLPCVFGTPSTTATETFVLAGDSHAAHLRAALRKAADDRGWHGVSMTKTGCPLSAARPNLPRELYEPCLRWRRELVQWLTERPAIRTLFVSQHSGASFKPTEGLADPRIDGYTAMWAQLPASVEHIVVLRDNPRVPPRTFDCVTRMIERRQGRRAGARCAVKRSYALREDPAVVAAKRLASPRVQVVDLSEFYCGRRECRPVIGGVLVNKDITHITNEFSRSLGPILSRKVRRMAAAWGPPNPPPAPPHG